ncbi:carboxypeptidase-like regulatory domain-containing protein [Marinicella meishanensis]|uniref:carboxypeptidase-like regulatory domain-containing protein n=1 Tax=Marinicella meishanensis TaxID=2873263 RepID=UPI001CBDDCF6|nr:carboxypeptidase-like regulatory domain-containing protein [Marinicella sp. NBU2979]
MKLLTLMVFMGMSLSIQATTKDHLATQKTVYDGLLIESRITPLQHQKFISQLTYQANQLQQHNPTPVEMLSQGGTATISGVVQSGAVNQPNVNLNLVEVGTNVYVNNAVTNALGEYTFVGVDAGDYYVLANDQNDVFIDAMYSSTGTVACQNCQPDANSTIMVATGAMISNIDLDLTVGAVINGQVTSGAAPVVDQPITLRGLNHSFYLYQTSDPTGLYSFQGLPDGEYYLTSQDATDIYVDAMYDATGTVQCQNCEPDVNSTVVLTPAEVRNGVDLSLTVGASISGQLVDQDTAAAVETFNLSMVDPSDLTFNWYIQAVFDGSGGYTVSGIPAGNYVFYLNPNSAGNLHIPEIYNNIQCNACSSLVFNGAGDNIALSNGVNTANIDFSVEFGASISGIILNNDHPTETVEQFGLIFLFNDANRLLGNLILYGTDTDPGFDGTYTIGGLLPGMYFVQGGDLGREFFQRELYENKPCPWSGCDRGAGGDPVVLGAQEQKLGVNYFLDYGGKISGTVTDAATGLPIGTTTQNHFLQFYDAAGQVAGGAFINPDGTYTSARAMPAGSYSVRTGSMFTGDMISPYVMEKYAPGGNIDCPGVTCDLTAGNVVVNEYVRLNPRDPVAEAANATTTGIDFALSPGFSFSGTITEIGSSTPIPDVHVLVYDDMGHFANWATTDVVGFFTVSGLPAGTYYALTNNGSNLPFLGVNQTAAGGWIDILYDGTPCPGSACDVTTGDPIVLGGAPDALAGGGTIDFSLDAGGTIIGQVRDAFSQLPAGGVNVNVYDGQGDFFGSYQTDDNGNYMTVGFPPGLYYLTTANNGALLDAAYGGAYCPMSSCDPLLAVPVEITGNETVVDIDFELKPDFIFKSGLD